MKEGVCLMPLPRLLYFLDSAGIRRPGIQFFDELHRTYQKPQSRSVTCAPWEDLPSLLMDTFSLICLLDMMGRCATKGQNGGGSNVPFAGLILRFARLPLLDG